MNIRVMTIEDYDEIFRIWLNTVGMGLRCIDDSLEGIAKFLKRNPTTSFVAEIDDKLIGVILCGHDGRRGYIYHAAVQANYRNNGVGRALVDAALEALKMEQINKVALVAFVSNELGNAFWKSVGFNKRDDLVYRNKSMNENNKGT